MSKKRSIMFTEQELPVEPKDVVTRFKDKPCSEITDYLYTKLVSEAKKEHEKEEAAKARRRGQCSDCGSSCRNLCDTKKGKAEEHDHEHDHEHSNSEGTEDDVEYIDDEDIEVLGDEAFVTGFAFNENMNVEDEFESNDYDDEDDGNGGFVNTATLAFGQLHGTVNNTNPLHTEDYLSDNDDGDSSNDSNSENSDNEYDGTEERVLDNYDYDPFVPEDDISLVDETNDEEKLRLLSTSKHSGIREMLWLLGLCDPHAYVAAVQAAGLPPRVCGKILAPGEHAYKCSTCENDDSCVLCVDCFEPAKHAGHTYRLIQVTGGCCDCGDPCAWSPAGFCSRHSSLDPHEDLLAHFPAQNLASTRAVVRAMVRAAACNVAEQRGNTPANVEIVGALSKLAKMLGYSFGRIVEEELTTKLPEGDDGGSFFVEPEDARMRGAALCRTPLWVLIEHDAVYRKAMRRELYSLYITLLVDPVFKMALGTTIAYLYRTINKNITALNTSVENSVMSLNVQVFTVPAYSAPIIRETDLLTNVLAELAAQFAPFISQGSGNGGFYAPEAMRFRRGSQVNMVYDLKLLLDQPANARLFLRSPPLLEAYLTVLAPLQGAFPYIHKKGDHVELEVPGADILGFLDFVFSASFEGLSAVLQPSTATASDSPKGIIIPNKLTTNGEDSDRPLTESERLEGLKIFSEGVIKATNKHLRRCPKQLVEYDDERLVHITPYDITNKSVSLFDPVSRLVALLVHAYLASGCSTEALQRQQSPALRLLLAEAPLEIFALSAQAQAGVWVRNGALMNYAASAVRAVRSFEKNLRENFFLLQYCAASAPRDAFVLTFLNRYGLLGRCTAFAEGAESAEHRPLVLSQALGDLLELALSVHGLPGADPRAAARDELVHILASKKSQPHGALVRTLRKAARPFLDELLPVVANKTSQTLTTPAKYTLKAECYADVDPYSILLTKQGLGVFEELWSDYVAFTASSGKSKGRKEKKKTTTSKQEPCNKPVFPCPRVRPAPHPLFAALPTLLSARPVVALIARVLGGEFTEEDGHIESRLLTVCLHVLMLCAEERAVCTLQDLETVVLDELTRPRSKTVGEKEGDKKKDTTALDALCNMYAKDRTFWLLERVLTSIKGNLAAIVSLVPKTVNAIDTITKALECSSDDTENEKDEGNSNSNNNNSNNSVEQKKAVKEKEKKKRLTKQGSILSKFLARSSSKLEELEKELGESLGSGIPPSKSPHLNDDDDSNESGSFSSSLSSSSSIGSSLSSLSASMSAADDNECVCVLCHESGGNLSWIGYCQRSDFLHCALRNCKDAVFWEGNCKEESEVGDDENISEKEGSKGTGSNTPVYEDPLMYYLKRGLRNGVYVQKCNHMIHESCLQKYIETTSRQNDEDEYAIQGVGAADSRKGLFLCPACKRLSNLTIPATGTLADSDTALPLTVLFKENDVADVHEYQDTYLELTRALAYTLASHELAARSNESESESSNSDSGDNLCVCAALPQAKVVLLRALYRVIVGLFSARDSSERASMAGVLDNLVLKHGEYHGCALSSFEPLTVLLLRAVLADASGEDAKEVICGGFLRKVTLAELARVTTATKSSTTSTTTTDSIALYIKPFQRRAALVLSAVLGMSTDQCNTQFTEKSEEESESEGDEISGWADALLRTGKGGRDSGFSPVVAAPASPFHLIQLPHMFMECVRAASKAVCPICKTHPWMPATCLVCGRVVCTAAPCCSDGATGECNIHAQYCLQGPAMYFFPLKGVVFLLRSDGAWGSPWHSPYIDEHGEEYIGTAHDTPLFLSPDRIKQLEKFLLEYELDNVCSDEKNAFGFLGIDWEQL